MWAIKEMDNNSFGHLVTSLKIRYKSCHLINKEKDWILKNMACKLNNIKGKEKLRVKCIEKQLKDNVILENN